jgi:hypothetical protein
MVSAKKFKPGDWVNHPEFGVGLVGDISVYDIYNPNRHVPDKNEVLVFFRMKETP